MIHALDIRPFRARGATCARTTCACMCSCRHDAWIRVCWCA